MLFALSTSEDVGYALVTLIVFVFFMVRHAVKAVDNRRV
jgi:hypothetical protein